MLLQPKRVRCYFRAAAYKLNAKYIFSLHIEAYPYEDLLHTRN